MKGMGIWGCCRNRGGLWGGPVLTMTVAMMESSASLKPSMRWELWGPSSSLLCWDESPSESTACSWVWGLDMVGPPSCHSSLGRSVALSLSVGCPRWPTLWTSAISMQKQGLGIETKKETLHKVAPSDSQPQAKSIGIRLISELCDWDDTLSLGKHWWYRVDAQHTMVPWKAWTLTPSFHYKLLYQAWAHLLAKDNVPEGCYCLSSQALGCF